MDARQAVRAYWDACEARDWARFADLLAPDVTYTLPQTRERVVGRDAYVRFNREYPGTWHLSIEQIVAGDAQAASVITFHIGGEELTGICFFDLDDDGLITSITDWWPEPYEPPSGREHLVERW
jgi:hypothetical protein